MVAGDLVVKNPQPLCTFALRFSMLRTQPIQFGLEAFSVKQDR